MAQQILTISQVNAYLQGVMDHDSMLQSIAVRGEISNYKIYPSGHHYFTLKDEGSALKCVMFKGNTIRLRFRPENGMQIIAMGRISVYPRDGAYQLYCSGLVPDGVGDLYAAFEQLKNKLSAEGLFDPNHKKLLPKFPKTIGIVTSAAGAAVHDMLRILNKRYPLCMVRIFPVRVQGAEAPQEIAGAIQYANYHNLVDLLIVGRGGGSMEDLWAFNDPVVAYAIYNSRIPIISAVGHEPDVTISDFVADLRAATPSNAAELAVPDQNALRQNLDSQCATIINILQNRLQAYSRQLRILSASPALQSPEGYLLQRRKQLTLLNNRLISAEIQSIGRSRECFLSAAAKLDALSPLKVIARGYSVVRTPEGALIPSVKQIFPGDNVNVLFRDGTASAQITFVKENACESE